MGEGVARGLASVGPRGDVEDEAELARVVGGVDVREADEELVFGDALDDAAQAGLAGAQLGRGRGGVPVERRVLAVALWWRGGTGIASLRAPCGKGERSAPLRRLEVTARYCSISTSSAALASRMDESWRRRAATDDSADLSSSFSFSSAGEGGDNERHGC